MGQDDTFHEAAFYVTRRMRSEWVNEETGVLIERLKFMHKAPRLALTWGTCRKPRRKNFTVGEGGTTRSSIPSK